MSVMFFPNIANDNSKSDIQAGIVSFMTLDSDLRFVEIYIGSEDSGLYKWRITNCLVQSITKADNVNFKTSISLNNNQYVYVFGDNVGELTVSAVLFRGVSIGMEESTRRLIEENTQKTETDSGEIGSSDTQNITGADCGYYLRKGIGDTIKFYDDIKLSKILSDANTTPNNLVMTFVFYGSDAASVFYGFLTGMSLNMSDPNSFITHVQFSFLPIKPSSRTTLDKSVYGEEVKSEKTNNTTLEYFT